MKLSVKILGASLFPFLIIIGLYHVLSIATFSHYLENTFRQKANVKLMQTEEDIRQFLINSEDHLQHLASISPPDSQHPAATRMIFSGLLQNDESFFQISAVNTRGQEWLRVNQFPTPEGEQKLRYLFSSPLYQHPMLELTTYLGNLSRPHDFPFPMLDITIPLQERQSGKITGVLWAKLSLQVVQTILERALPVQGKLSLIQATSGNFLIQADDSKQDFTALESEVIQEIQHRNEANGILEKRGADLTLSCAYRTFHINDMNFIVSVKG